MTCWRCTRCGFVQPDTHDADCDGCGGWVEPLDRPMRHHERKEYTFATWADGPDSEAARAARGEGHSMPADWHQHLAEVEAEHEGICGQCGGECEPDPVPDPSYTPAVRRVVAWTEIQGREPEDGDWLYATKEAAYEQTAADRIVACLRARGCDGGEAEEWWGNPPPGDGMVAYNMAAIDRAYSKKVRDRWAQVLRHRDENAGRR